LNRIFPFPFDPTAALEDCTQLRIYYPDGIFDGFNIAQTSLYFDIVIAKSLWLIKGDDGKSAIRPYLIMKELVNHFTNRSIGTIGKIKFTHFQHLNVNSKFDAIRLGADMYLFSGS
jgi:hypothetical protein